MKRKSLKKWLLFLGEKNLNLCFLKKLRKSMCLHFWKKCMCPHFCFDRNCLCLYTWMGLVGEVLLTPVSFPFLNPWAASQPFP
jgi:hypothetical protein